MVKNTHVAGLILFYVLALFSCNQNHGKKSGNNFIDLNIDTLISDKPIYFSTYFSNVHLIPLDFNPQSVIGNIYKMKLFHDTLYIFDLDKIKTLFLFSKQGEYLSKICRIGKRPGEYMEPLDFDLDEKTNEIFIYDWSDKKVKIYNAGGDYLDNININKRFSSFIESDKMFYFFISSPAEKKDMVRNDYLLYQYDKKGKIHSKKFKFSDYSYGLNYNTLPGMGNFYKAKNDIKLYMPFCDTIFSIRDEKVAPFLTLSTVKYKLTRKDADRIKNNKKVSIYSELMAVNKLYNIKDYCEFNDFLFFKFDIGHRHFWTFYNLKTRGTACSSTLADDMTYLNLDLFPINDHQFAGIVPPKRFPKLREVVLSGKMSLSDIDKEIILKSSGYPNPIIIIYDAKVNKD
jgi:hypothetical protein